MNRRSIGKHSVISAVLLILSCAENAWAFGIGTHKLLNVQAADVSTLDDYAKKQLGLTAGLLETFNGRRVRQWIELGGAAEDEAFSIESLGAAFRSRQHFHNPLLPWDQAGLNAPSLCTLGLPLIGQASVRWAQNPDQGLSGRAAWTDARQAFLRALTLPSKAERDTAWAQTFQILGQQMHLVADLAAPAHTRNDPHCVADGFEAWASRSGKEPSFQSLLAGPPIRPALSIFTLGVPISDPIAKAPIARLWDTDQYVKTNPDITLSPTIGLAEYSNANFFSDDTVFNKFPFPASTSVALGSPEPEPKTGELRRYFKKVRDGEAINHLAVPSALYEFLPDALKDKEKGLDDKVFQDYGEKLLPRAVGYSATLLDYFFRGKLDLDLVEDPDNPSVFRLTGTNGSTEPLVDGTLTLFADDPNGLRSQATALDPTNVTDIGPGQAVSSARFQAPENAEQLIAVYQGTLGQEVKSSDPSAPGAVIGKVLGGVRVEEVFSDGTRWKIRTPRGVFLLPLTVAEFENVKWGDADNTLLAQTPFGPDQPNRFVVYEVQRQPDSVEFKTVATPDGPEVEVSQKREVVFPFGLSLGTVRFSHTIQYRQRLARYSRTSVETWTVPNPKYPNNGYYQPSPTEYSPLTFETALEQEVPFTLNFDIALDLDHNWVFSFIGGPYRWALDPLDVGVDASGRLVALVIVALQNPTVSPTVELPYFGVNPQGDLNVISHVRLGPEFPVAMGSWALIDLTEGRVLASTTDSVIALSRQEVVDWFGPGDVWVHTFKKRVGGPQAGLADLGWAHSPLQPPGNDSYAVVAEVQSRGGDQAVSVEGVLRPELQEGLSPAFFLGVQRDSSQSVHDFLCDCGPSPPSSAVRIVETGTLMYSATPTLDEALRARFASGGARMVLIAQGLEGPRLPVLWDPTTPQARLLPFPEGLEPDFLWAATDTTAMATTYYDPCWSWPNCWASILISLEGAQAPSLFPGVELPESFVLLDPSFLYNMEDGKFYSPQPPLRRTALPAKLADVAGNPIGDYHAVRLP